MRLLMTTDTVGGVWTYTTELVEGLLQKGAAVALVSLGCPSAAQTRWLVQTKLRSGDAFLCEVGDVPLEWMNDNGRAYLDAEPLLLRVVGEFKPDVLHSNQFCFGALPLSIPKLLVAHSDVLSWAAVCRDKAIEACLWLDTYYALVAAGLRGADAVVAPTHWMLGALAANFQVSCPAYVVANGRSIKTQPTADRQLQAVIAGRLWDEAKNLKLLADVQLPFPLFVAGDAEYQSSVFSAFPAGAVALGSLEERDLLTLLQRSAIYICTSRYEPFGLAPLEAALCGCAVLANDIPSLREVWGSGALYFRDAGGLSALLAQLACDARQLRAAQHRSRRRAQGYSAKRMTEQYLALYESMLAKREIFAHGA